MVRLVRPEFTAAQCPTVRAAKDPATTRPRVGREWSGSIAMVAFGEKPSDAGVETTQTNRGCRPYEVVIWEAPSG